MQDGYITQDLPNLRVYVAVLPILTHEEAGVKQPFLNLLPMLGVGDPQDSKGYVAILPTLGRHFATPFVLYPLCMHRCLLAKLHRWQCGIH